MINISSRDRDRLVHFMVDFNVVDNGNRLRGLGPYATGDWQSLGPGAWVVAVDDESNECLAIVEQRNGDFFYMRADWETWQDGDKPKVLIGAGLEEFSTSAVPTGLR